MSPSIRLPSRLGIFGGTFDPPHIGHLILAAEAFYQLGLDRLLWVLTADPPHKQDRWITPLADRLDMVQSAIAGNPSFELSRIDIDRPPPHYALDTLRIVKSQNPQAELIYLIGGDSLVDLPTWHRPQAVVQEADAIAVFRRPGYRVDIDALEKEIPGIGARLRFVDSPLLEISSTEIRRRAAWGGPIRYYLPLAVMAIIEERKLYRRERNEPSPAS